MTAIHPKGRYSESIRSIGRWKRGGTTLALALLLIGCGAEAQDEKGIRAIYAAVDVIQCANTADDKASGVTDLTVAIQNYQPHGDQDALNVVEGALLDHDQGKCAKSRPKP